MKYVLILVTLAAFKLASYGQEAIKIDPRVYLHYTPEQIEELKANPKKLKCVNYLYSQSFIVNNRDCSGCTPIDPQTFDVATVERFRKQSERVTVGVSREGHTVTLLSRDELQAIYNTF
ncbi:MAG: hypothetical protein NZ455_16140 [Bacteroidia bacterium]|nr:hypothetical protein [Bacteroidia bacterium]